MDFSGWVGASAEDTSSPNGARPSAHTFGTTTAQAPWLMLLPNIRIYPTVYAPLMFKSKQNELGTFTPVYTSSSSGPRVLNHRQ